ncbi:hypothetical protein N7478_008620 [Penicillium angulare]|uniref:uncharacterized protein n=1 Tax=Penicillium angulare TaxID=116970 RepID=UPI002540905B|nr:uncharacterized protein N7478_008620 [Penicillium angulare]KAJ5273495.1 hypothetical protein N7478_008620 [Penicillium angulare]
MQFLATLALLAATATAGPVTKNFNLQTSGASNSSLNNLYVTTESTGPLNSLAVFTSNVASAGSFSLQTNGTVHYKAQNGAPWSIALVSEDVAVAPVDVSVEPSTGGTGFSFASDGNLQSSNKNWGGWLACNDNALYYINTSQESSSHPGCDKIELKTSS